MSMITLRVNGSSHTVDVDPATPLLYILRNDLGLQGPRFGCGLGQCGACTVIINGLATRSCITPVSTVKSEVTTLEGISTNGKLHPLQQAWIDEQVPQCGFCQNGQIMTAKAMLDKTPHPTDAQIRETMNCTLCRCFSHYRVQTAIKRVVGERHDIPSGIPKQIEDVLVTHRRGFLRSAGLFAVSIGAFTTAGSGEADAQGRRGHIPFPISIRSIRGSSFIQTTRPLFMSARRTLARGPAQLSAS